MGIAINPESNNIRPQIHTNRQINQKTQSKDDKSNNSVAK